MDLTKREEKRLGKYLEKTYGRNNFTVEQKVDAIISGKYKPTITTSQARKDLEYLKSKYGSANDFCGSFCNCEVLNNILMGKKSIKDAIIENIKHYFSNGIEDEYRGCSSDLLPDLDDSRVQRIMDRYDISL